MSARARPAAKDFSRLLMAWICAGQSEPAARAGNSRRRFARIEPPSRGSGSRRLVKNVSRARALVTERERSLPRRQPKRNAGNILRGLLLGAGERDASGLGFGCADGFAVNELRVV